MIAHAIYAFNSSIEILEQQFDVSLQGASASGCVLRDGAVVLWENDNLLLCFGEQVIAIVEKIGFVKQDTPSHSVDPSKTSVFGLGLQVALLDPLSTNSITCIPRDMRNDFLATVDPKNFWLIGQTNNGTIIFVVQGKGNIDKTIGFEYTLAEELEAEKLEMRVFYRGCDITPIKKIPLEVNCKPKGTILPRVHIPSIDYLFLLDLNYDLLCAKFRFTYLEDKFEIESEPGRPMYYIDPDYGIGKVAGETTFLIHTTESQVEKIYQMYGQSIHGLPVEITVEPFTRTIFYSTLAATKYISWLRRPRMCVLL